MEMRKDLAEIKRSLFAILIILSFGFGLMLDIRNTLKEMQPSNTTTYHTTGEINGTQRTVQLQTVQDTKQISDVPSTQGKKSWMPIEQISTDNKTRWDLLELCLSDENGIYRYDGMPVVALGTYYNPQIGDIYAVVLDMGITFSVVVGDVKSDNDTDGNNQYTVATGCMMEFIVDTDRLQHTKAYITGDISDLDGFNGDVVYLEKRGEVVGSL